jgi:hypothetical protein
MMEMGSMPGGSFPPPGVLCSVKTDHDLYSESGGCLYRKAKGSANFRGGFEQILRRKEGNRIRPRNGDRAASPLVA